MLRTDLDHIAANTDERLALGVIERIGGESVITLWTASTGAAQGPVRRTASLRDLRAAVEWVIQWLAGDDSGVDLASVADITAVGHRVVHGGERFKSSVLIDASVLDGISETIDLAPLHNPHNLRGIQAARAVLGAGIPQVAVFDTAFHQTLPEHAFLYGVPYSLYRRYRVRRYGFHGTSHRYIAYRWRQLSGASREDTHIISLHLGNGCSACAIRGGSSIDTSMGFTPLEGLVMGTRSGDVDPALLDFVAAKEGLSLSQVDSLLNQQSGLLGISGLTNDMRELLAEEQEHGDRRARLAIDIFCYRVRKYIGAYAAAIGEVRSVVFAGGIGENAAPVRARILEGLEFFGLELDASANARAVGGAEGRISTDESRVHAWVVATDEELLIARDTVRVVSGVEVPY